MKRERIFYLDFIRAIAAIAIVITHYNARYIYMVPQALEKAIITTRISNVYIGDWGVSLFFIISGAALMYVYGEKCELRSFYKKRFLSIYPMFWIAYITVFFFDWITTGVHAGTGVPKRYFLLSVVGMDGLLSQNVPTYYLLGEWFLGTIICLYILFPLLRKLMNEMPIVLLVGTTILYVYFIAFYTGSFPVTTLIFTRLPEIVFGMFFIKARRAVKGWGAAAAFLVLVLNGIWKPAFPNNLNNLQTTYVGIATFLVLVYISGYMGKIKAIEKVCMVVSKYSYAVFLTHHVIIGRVTDRIDLTSITVAESWILFAVLCILIAICTAGLYWVHHFVMKGIACIQLRIMKNDSRTKEK